MKKLTDPRLRKLRANAVAAAAIAKDGRAEVSLDGHDGKLIGYKSGRVSLALRYRRPDSGKTAKLVYAGAPLTAAGTTKWLADRRAEIAQGIDPGRAVQEAKVAAQLAQANSLRSICERWLAQRKGDGLRSLDQVRKNLERLVYP